MKNIIVIVKKVRKIEELLAEKVDKVAMAEVTKMWNVIDISNKYSCAISIVDINAAKNLKLIYVKKY